MSNFKTAMQVPSTFPPKFALSSKDLYLFDCERGAYGSVQSTNAAGHNGDGETVWNWSIPVSAVQMVDVVPDSIGEIMLHTVCNFRRDSKTKPM